MNKLRTVSSGDRSKLSASQVNEWNRAAIRSQTPPIPPGSHGDLNKIIVKLKQDIDIGEWGECVEMVGPKGEEVESDSTYWVYNRFGDLSEDTLAHAEYIVNGWEITAAGCE